MTQIDRIKMEAVFRRLDHLDAQARSLAECCHSLAEEAYEIQRDLAAVLEDKQEDEL